MSLLLKPYSQVDEQETDDEEIVTPTNGINMTDGTDDQSNARVTEQPKININSTSWTQNTPNINRNYSPNNAETTIDKPKIVKNDKLLNLRNKFSSNFLSPLKNLEASRIKTPTEQTKDLANNTAVISPSTSGASEKAAHELNTFAYKQCTQINNLNDLADNVELAADFLDNDECSGDSADNNKLVGDLSNNNVATNTVGSCRQLNCSVKLTNIQKTKRRNFLRSSALDNPQRVIRQQ